jgi:chitinase
MSPSFLALTALTGALAVMPTAMAGFDPNSQSNMAIYWGQNSFGQGSGPNVQERLAYYCDNPDIDIIPIGFLNGLAPPQINFANASDNCTTFPEDSSLLDCPQLEYVLPACQS